MVEVKIDRNLYTEEMKVENLERRRFTATFDRVELTLQLRAGFQGNDCVVWGYIDAVSAHDEAVLKVEQAMDVVDQRKKVFAVASRLYRSFEGLYSLMEVNREQLSEYLNLKQETENYESRIQQIRDTRTKAQLEEKWKRFQEIAEWGARVVDAQSELMRLRRERDDAATAHRLAENQLELRRQEEERFAGRITDDHVIAVERDAPVESLFPFVRLGFSVSRVNDRDVVGKPFDEILEMIELSSSPQLLEFHRYDYRYNVITGEWETLAELRERGVHVEDARISRTAFADLGADGNVGELRKVLEAGEDINAADYTGNTALHRACANGHLPAIELLVNLEAKLDPRDKMMMTPLLLAARAGELRVVRWLVERGADVGATDRMLRGANFYAVQSGNIDLMRYTVRQGANINLQDQNWLWTPLHLAANDGDEEMVEALLEEGASLYRFSRAKKLPEHVARDAHFTRLADHLHTLMLNDPAQLFVDDKVDIWFGCEEALEPRWFTDLGFQAVLSILDKGRPPTHLPWVTAQEDVWHEAISMRLDDIDYSTVSWRRFMERLGQMVEFIHRAVQNKRRVLVHCTAGVSTSPVAVACYMLLRHGQRLEDTVPRLRLARPSIEPSKSLLRGAESMQRRMDEKRIKRLTDRVRESPVLSLGF